MFLCLWLIKPNFSSLISHQVEGSNSVMGWVRIRPIPENWTSDPGGNDTPPMLAQTAPLYFEQLLSTEKWKVSFALKHTVWKETCWFLWTKGLWWPLFSNWLSRKATAEVICDVFLKSFLELVNYQSTWTVGLISCWINLAELSDFSYSVSLQFPVEITAIKLKWWFLKVETSGAIRSACVFEAQLLMGRKLSLQGTLGCRGTGTQTTGSRMKMDLGLESPDERKIHLEQEYKTGKRLSARTEARTTNCLFWILACFSNWMRYFACKVFLTEMSKSNTAMLVFGVETTVTPEKMKVRSVCTTRTCSLVLGHLKLNMAERRSLNTANLVHMRKSCFSIVAFLKW